MYTTDQVAEQFSRALQNGHGALFVGSGISVPSGLPDWTGFLAPLLAPIGISLRTGDDLPLMAQYVVNYHVQNRGPLISELKQRLSGSFPLNCYHDALRRTVVNVIWTTNFDTLLEDNYSRFRPAVYCDDPDLTAGTADPPLEIIKIHGCIDRSPQNRLVITSEDYEDFAFSRPAIARRLSHDLLHRNFLFIGYSYSDPNIRTILVEARRLAQRATRSHFLLSRLDPNLPDGDRKRAEQWAIDLRRVGIHCTFFDDYRTLEEVLKRIALASRGKTVFVTGSHIASSQLAEELGKLLATDPAIVLLDGQSDGIGRVTMNSFGSACVRARHDLRKRVQFFPNPYSVNPSFASDPGLLSVLKEWRGNLFRSAHTVVVFDGKMGTKAETEVAREMGCQIIPVPEAAGGFAEELFSDPNVRGSLQSFAPAYAARALTRSVTANDIFDAVKSSFQ